MVGTGARESREQMFLRARSILTLAALLLATMLPAAAPAAVSATDLTIGQAESRMISLINADRAQAGLRALRVDSRLMAIARARSEDMATSRSCSGRPHRRRFRGAARGSMWGR